MLDYPLKGHRAWGWHQSQILQSDSDLLCSCQSLWRYHWAGVVQPISQWSARVHWCAVSPLIINTGCHIVYYLKRFVASQTILLALFFFSWWTPFHSPGKFWVRMHARVLHLGANDVSALFLASGCSRYSTFTSQYTSTITVAINYLKENIVRPFCLGK